MKSGDHSLFPGRKMQMKIKDSENFSLVVFVLVVTPLGYLIQPTQDANSIGRRNQKSEKSSSPTRTFTSSTVKYPLSKDFLWGYEFIERMSTKKSLFVGGRNENPPINSQEYSSINMCESYQY